MPALCLVFYTGLSILQKCPHKLNYQVRVTPGNSEALHRPGVQMLRHTKLFCLLLFAYINHTALLVAQGRSDGIDPLISGGLFMLLMALAVTSIIRMSKLQNA